MSNAVMRTVLVGLYQKSLFLSFLLLIFLACSSENGVETLPEESQEVVKVWGRVVMPAPVVDGTVEVFFLEDAQWKLVGTSQTDEYGFYEVDTVLDEGQVVLVVCKGDSAVFVDSVSYASLPLGARELRAMAVLSQDTVRGIYLDPFSTLAAALAQARSRTAGDDTADWADLISKANGDIAEHLSRPVPPSIPTTELFDPTLESLPWPSMKTLLGLSAVGLSQLASNLSVEAGQSVTVLDLLEALEMDLSDGQFNGLLDAAYYRTQAPEIVVAGLPADASWTRHLLAGAVHQFCTGSTNVSLVESSLLGVRDGYYQDISVDLGVLYGPNGDEWEKIPFDPFSPEVLVTAPETQDWLCGDTSLVVLATDNIRVDDLWLTGEHPIPAPTQLTAESEGSMQKEWLLEGGVHLVDGGNTVLTVHATDIAGNTSEAEFSLRGDFSPPTVVLSDPSSAESCLTSSQDFVTLFVQDDAAGVATVTIEQDGETRSCTQQSFPRWNCPIIPDKEGDVLIVATDQCGHGRTLEFFVCFDLQYPTITFNPPEGTWRTYGADQVTVTVTDDKAVSYVQVLVNDTIVALKSEVGGEFVLSLSEWSQYDQSIRLRVTAQDPSGHQVTQVSEYPVDWVNPQVVLEGGLGIRTVSPGNLISIPFLVIEEGSGVNSVDVTFDAGTWQVQENSDGEYDLLGSLSQVLSDTVVTVTIQVTDVAGNVGDPVAIPVWVDATPPEIVLLESSFSNEHNATSTYDRETGVVEWTIHEADPTVLSMETCSEGCPPIHKMAPRMDWDPDAEEHIDNTPMIKLNITDTCHDFGPYDPGYTLTYRFFDDLDELHSGTVAVTPCSAPTVELPLATPTMLGMGIAEVDFSNQVWPNRLELEVFDLVGQQATLTLDLDIVVHVPPVLLVAPMPTEFPSTWLGSHLESESPTLHHVLNDGVLTRFVLVNPYPIELDVQFIEVPGEYSLWEGQTFYHYDTSSGPGLPMCGPGTCSYETQSAWGACTAPETLGASVLLEETYAATDLRLTESLTASVQTAAAGERYHLLNSRLYYVDILRRPPATQPEAAFITVDLWDGEMVSIYSLGSEMTRASCNADGTSRVWTIDTALNAFYSTVSPGSKLQLRSFFTGSTVYQSLEAEANWNHLYQAPELLTYPIMD